MMINPMLLAQQIRGTDEDRNLANMTFERQSQQQDFQNRLSLEKMAQEAMAREQQMQLAQQKMAQSAGLAQQQMGLRKQQLDAQTKGRLLETAAGLYGLVTDQGSLDAANAQFEQTTGRPAPYRGKQWTPDFQRVLNNQLLYLKGKEPGQTKPGKPVAVMGPNGPVYVTEADAIGKSPVPKAQNEKPLTEGQGKASLYGSRMAQSDKILRSIEDKVSLPGLGMAQSMGTVGNYLMSSDQQRVDQAQRDFLNAVLRQESGAVISDQEFENGKRQYFPIQGNSKAVIEQKRRNRQIAIQGMMRMSGPAAKDILDIVNSPLMPSQQEHTEQQGQRNGSGKGGVTYSNWGGNG